MKTLEDKTCIVTGADTEIGGECAIKLAHAGGKIILLGENEAKLLKNTESIKESGGKAEFFAFDRWSWEKIKESVEFAVEKFGNPDVLVNYFSLSLEKPLESTGEEEWAQIISHNLGNYFAFVRETISYMKMSGGGSIINISSIQAARGVHHQSACSTAQGGIQSLTRSAAVEYASHNIRVNSVLMGIIKTEEYRRQRSTREPEFEKKILRHIPAGRLGKPQEVASTVLFLAGENASYITGASIPVDGGYCIN
jgi:NAD(P)-dependent dehydrogenase (short-subunit alcohol dehydrogenase family)